MDWMILIICLSLVSVGIIFFGFPLGWKLGRRKLRREYADKYFVHPLPECVAESRKRLDESDVLNAEFIELKTEARNG